MEKEDGKQPIGPGSPCGKKSEDNLDICFQTRRKKGAETSRPIPPRTKDQKGPGAEKETPAKWGESEKWGRKTQAGPGGLGF